MPVSYSKEVTQLNQAGIQSKHCQYQTQGEKIGVARKFCQENEPQKSEEKLQAKHKTLEISIENNEGLTSKSNRDKILEQNQEGCKSTIKTLPGALEEKTETSRGAEDQ